jgi:hypothetical protein
METEAVEESISYDIVARITQYGKLMEYCY